MFISSPIFMESISQDTTQAPVLSPEAPRTTTCNSDSILVCLGYVSFRTDSNSFLVKYLSSQLSADKSFLSKQRIADDLEDTIKNFVPPALMKKCRKDSYMLH